MMLKVIYNNRFYFWLLFVSMTFISYLSIYESLVINRTYSLIPIFFASYFSLFILFQLTSMFTWIAILSKFKLNEINKNANRILDVKRNVVLVYIVGLYLFIAIKFL